MIYFSIAGVSLVLCIGACFVLQRLPITKYWLNEAITASSAAHRVTTDQVLAYNTTVPDSQWRKDIKLSERAIIKKIWLPALMVTYYW
jgi:hypothetical protein